jgi:hypothetical protein
MIACAACLLFGVVIWEGRKGGRGTIFGVFGSDRCLPACPQPQPPNAYKLMREERGGSGEEEMMMMMIRMRIRYRYGIRMRIVGNEGMRRRRKG